MYGVLLISICYVQLSHFPSHLRYIPEHPQISMIIENYKLLLVLRMYYTYIIFFVNLLLMNDGKTMFLEVMMLILSMECFWKFAKLLFKDFVLLKVLKFNDLQVLCPGTIIVLHKTIPPLYCPLTTTLYIYMTNVVPISQLLLLVHFCNTCLLCM
jgi:hypothetical protein